MRPLGIHSWKRLAAAAAMAGLVLQLFLVSFHAGRSVGSPGASSSGLQSVVICTAHGIATILVDANGNPTEIPAKPGDVSTVCPLCAALGAFALAQPEGGATLQAPRAVTLRAHVYDVGAVAFSMVEIHRNRGPPALAVS